MRGQFATLVRKGARDARGVAIAGGLAVVAIVALHTSVYPQYGELGNMDYPEAMRGIFGQAGSIARPEGYIAAFWTNTLMLVAVLAVIVGSAATASEERDGTLDVLLAQPVSRARLLLGKGAGIALALTVAMLLAWPAFVLANLYAGLDISAAGFAAVTLSGVPLVVLFLAFALWAGAVMPSRAGAALAASTVVVALYFLFMLGTAVPLLDGPRRATPFYWSDAAHVLIDGFDWLRAAGELLLAGALVALAVRAFERREIATGNGAPVSWWGWLARLRHPRGGGAAAGVVAAGAGPRGVARLGGAYAGRLGVARKTWRDVRLAAIASGIAAFVFALLLVGLYPAYRDALAGFEYPGALQGLLGEAGSFASPEGFLSGEFFGFAPLILIAMAILAGTGAIAGEEGAGTLDVLLAQPVGRVRLLVVKAAVIAVALALALAAALPGFWLGRQVADMDMAVTRFAAALVPAILVTLLFLALALLAAVSLPDRSAAATATAAALVAAYLVHTLSFTVGWLAGPDRLTPFYWADASHVLVDGFDPARVAVLIAVTAALFALALWRFARRDVVIGRRERGAWWRPARPAARIHLPRRHTPTAQGR